MKRTKDEICERVKAMIADERAATTEYNKLKADIFDSPEVFPETRPPYVVGVSLATAVAYSIETDENKHRNLLEALSKFLRCE